MDLIINFFLNALAGAFYLSFVTAYIWFPVVLLFAAWHAWVYYVQANFRAEQKWVLLEIKIPKETYKSPLAMEVVLNALHQTGGESTWYDRYILGKIRTWFSLEIVSIDGRLRFFIYTREFFRKVIESQIYSQYPGIEIYEAPDYVEHVPYGQRGSDWGLFGAEYKLTKDDPYPIKTYVDYGLDKDPKEEFKIDPLSSVLELLGSVGKDEQFWVQILVRATKKSNRKAGGLFGQAQDWKKEGEDLIKKLKEDIAKQNKPKEGESFSFRPMTKGETDTIAAIEHNISKLGFDCGIRTLYLAKGDAFNPQNVPGVLGLFRQFGTNELNGFGISAAPGFDYPWQDFLSFKGFSARSKEFVKSGKYLKKGAGAEKIKETLFNAYIRRSYFHPPYKRKWFVLNSEELATIYHFPGGVADIPTLERIESKKVEPPANLPI